MKEKGASENFILAIHHLRKSQRKKKGNKSQSSYLFPCGKRSPDLKKMGRRDGAGRKKGEEKPAKSQPKVRKKTTKGPSLVIKRGEKKETSIAQQQKGQNKGAGRGWKKGEERGEISNGLT